MAKFFNGLRTTVSRLINHGVIKLSLGSPVFTLLYTKWLSNSQQLSYQLHYTNIHVVMNTIIWAVNTPQAINWSNQLYAGLCDTETANIYASQIRLAKYDQYYFSSVVIVVKCGLFSSTLLCRWVTVGFRTWEGIGYTKMHQADWGVDSVHTFQHWITLICFSQASSGRNWSRVGVRDVGWMLFHVINCDNS